jgi:hypothetical protein
VAWRRQRVDLERTVASRPVLGRLAGDGDLLEQREPVLPQVVVVVHLAVLPAAVDVGDELALQGRNPDPDSRLRRPAQPLELVAVVVGQQDVGRALDAELAEVVEHGARAEVDEHGLGSGPDDVDVAGIAEAPNVRRHLGEQ